MEEASADNVRYRDGDQELSRGRRSTEIGDQAEGMMVGIERPSEDEAGKGDGSPPAIDNDANMRDVEAVHTAGDGLDHGNLTAAATGLVSESRTDVDWVPATGNQVGEMQAAGTAAALTDADANTIAINEALDDHGNSAAEVEQPQAQNQAAEAENDIACRICFEKLAPGRLLYLNCGCVYCVECLNAHFRSGLANKASYPPRCCGPIDVGAVQVFLDDGNLIRYTNVLEEFAAGRPLYCANKECEKGYIGDADLQPDDPLMFCPECALQTCARCREIRDVHTDNDGILECPDSLILAEVKEMADEEKWRRCPGCRHLVEKMDGCDHMICDCRMEFHYVCGQEYSNDGRCGCGQNPGWADNGDSDDEEVDGRDRFHGGPDEEDFEGQLPPHIWEDLHRPDDFPFSFQAGDQAPAEVIGIVIADTHAWLNHVPEEERDVVTADPERGMQDIEGEETVEPAAGPIEARGVTEAALLPPEAGEIREAGVQVDGQRQQAWEEAPANQEEEQNDAEENDSIETMEETVRTALTGFENAASELQNRTAALVRGRRRRAERMLGELVRADGRGRGRGADRGGRRARGRGRGGRGGVVGQHVG